MRVPCHLPPAGIVTRYCREWETVVTRLGRWIDFRNDYKTMEPWYMESVWCVPRGSRSGSGFWRSEACVVVPAPTHKAHAR